jgi:N6-L-threonylcarbamoyladenine synthase
MFVQIPSAVFVFAQSLRDLLELPFPSGKHLDALSRQAQGREVFKVKCPGMEFSLSGVQNKVETFHRNNGDSAETAAYALRCVCHAVMQATKNALKAYPGLRVVFSGGVASNSMLRSELQILDPIFSEPQFSTDNAMGVAVLTARAMEG